MPTLVVVFFFSWFVSPIHKVSFSPLLFRVLSLVFAHLILLYLAIVYVLPDRHSVNENM